MSTGLIVALVFVFLIIVCVGYFISVQRKAVSMDEFCQNAMSQIAVQINSRWDAIMGLAKDAARYSEHESNVLINSIKQLRIGEVTSAAEANQQQDAITGIMSRIMAIGNAYPELKASEMFGKLMDGRMQYEENVRMSRMVYNDTATKYNRLIRMFPSSIVCSMLGYNEKKEYLKVDDPKKNAYPDTDEVFKK